MLGATARRNAAKLGKIFTELNSAKTQTRGVGNLPVKGNKYIEDFGARRETIEKEFRWDGATIRRLAIWGIAVPVGIYKMMVRWRCLSRWWLVVVVGGCWWWGVTSSVSQFDWM